MCEASHVKFAPVCHQIVQVHMYENVTYGPSHIMKWNLHSDRTLADFRFRVMEDELLNKKQVGLHRNTSTPARKFK